MLLLSHLQFNDFNDQSERERGIYVDFIRTTIIIGKCISCSSGMLSTNRTKDYVHCLFQ